MTLRVTVLGCSGTYPGPGGACSGYLVRSPTTSVWVDAGSGSFSNLLRHVGLEKLDAIVLSHQHGDHWLELPVVRNTYKYVLGQSGLPVYGPAALHTVANALMGDVDDTFAWTDTADGDSMVIGDIAVQLSRTDHPVVTLAARFEHEGRALAYSADTGPEWSMAAFGAPIDLALWEATFVDDVPVGVQHMSAPRVGDLAAQARVRRLLLTHLLPGTDATAAELAAAEQFGQVVGTAAVGRTYTV